MMYCGWNCDSLAVDGSPRLSCWSPFRGYIVWTIGAFGSFAHDDVDDDCHQLWWLIVSWSVNEHIRHQIEKLSSSQAPLIARLRASTYLCSALILHLIVYFVFCKVIMEKISTQSLALQKINRLTQVYKRDRVQWYFFGVSSQYQWEIFNFPHHFCLLTILLSSITLTFTLQK